MVKPIRVTDDETIILKQQAEVEDKAFKALWKGVVIGVLVATVVVTTMFVSTSPVQTQQTREQRLECFDKAIKAGMVHGYALRFCEIE